MKYNWWISDQISIYCCYCTRQKFLFWPKCLEKWLPPLCFFKCQIIFYRTHTQSYTHTCYHSKVLFFPLPHYLRHIRRFQKTFLLLLPFSPNCMFWNAIEIFLHIFTSPSTVHTFYILKQSQFCNGNSKYISGLAFFPKYNTWKTLLMKLS